MQYNNVKLFLFSWNEYLQGQLKLRTWMTTLAPLLWNLQKMTWKKFLMLYLLMRLWVLELLKTRVIYHGSMQIHQQKIVRFWPNGCSPICGCSSLDYTTPLSLIWSVGKRSMKKDLWRDKEDNFEAKTRCSLLLYLCFLGI